MTGMTIPSAFPPIKNRFGILYLLSLVFLLQSLAVRMVLFVKALPGMTHDPLVLVRMVSVGFLYDCVTFTYCAIPFALLLVLAPREGISAPLLPVRHARGFFRRPVRSPVRCRGRISLFRRVRDALQFHRHRLSGLYPGGCGQYPGVLSPEQDTSRPWYGRCSALSPPQDADRSVRLPPPRARSSCGCARGSSWPCCRSVALLFVDQSWTNISRNSYANELAGNGIYDLFAAFRNNELDFQKLYLTMDEDKALHHLQELLSEKNGPLRRQRSTGHRAGGRQPPALKKS